MITTVTYLLFMTFLAGAMVPMFCDADSRSQRLICGVAFLCLMIGILAHPLVNIL